MLFDEAELRKIFDKQLSEYDKALLEKLVRVLMQYYPLSQNSLKDSHKYVDCLIECAQERWDK